jgi:hypothetical protein
VSSVALYEQVQVVAIYKAIAFEELRRNAAAKVAYLRYEHPAISAIIICRVCFVLHWREAFCERDKKRRISLFDCSRLGS